MFFCLDNQPGVPSPTLLMRRRGSGVQRGHGGQEVMSALNLTPIFCLHHPTAAAVTRFLPLLLASLVLFTFHSEFTLFSPRPGGGVSRILAQQLHFSAIRGLECGGVNQSADSAVEGRQGKQPRLTSK